MADGHLAVDLRLAWLSTFLSDAPQSEGITLLLIQREARPLGDRPSGQHAREAS